MIFKFIVFKFCAAVDKEIRGFTTKDAFTDISDYIYYISFFATFATIDK